MIDIATGFSIEAPTACSTRAAISGADARCEAAQERGGREEADARATKVRRRPKPVADRAGEQQQAGHRDRVGADGPLQPGRGPRPSASPTDGEGDVDHGDVEADDEDAHRADQRHPDAGAFETAGRRQP